MSIQKKEIWKYIPGYNKNYQTSNLGNVRSLRFNKILTMKPSKDSQGYLRLGLTVDNKKNMLSVHRLVLIAFKPNPLNLPQCNHINGIRDDNRIENLEWCTSYYNVMDSYKRLGGWPNPGAKLTVPEVIEIKKLLLANNNTPTEISKMYNVHLSTIYKIMHKHRWKHVTIPGVLNG